MRKRTQALTIRSILTDIKCLALSGQPRIHYHVCIENNSQALNGHSILTENLSPVLAGRECFNDHSCIGNSSKRLALDSQELLELKTNFAADVKKLGSLLFQIQAVVLQVSYPSKTGNPGQITLMVIWKF